MPAYQAATESLSFEVTNAGTHTAEVAITNSYTGDVSRQSLLPGKSFSQVIHLKALYGWYDLAIRVAGDASFLQHIAGHLETGKDSATDPALGGIGRAP